MCINTKGANEQGHSKQEMCYTFCILHLLSPGYRYIKEFPPNTFLYVLILSHPIGPFSCTLHPPHLPFSGTPTKRQVSKRQVSKRLVSKHLVSKRQVYKTSDLQNVRFQNVWFQNIQFLNLIYLLHKKCRN
jgi:hypothetical protein